MEPKWLTRAMAEAMHVETLAAFGGPQGVRDEALLDSALARPRQLFACGDDPSLFDLAAAYCAGLISNHPFIDGNKRTGILAAHASLALNGYVFRPQESDVVNIVMAVAAGEIDEQTLSAWLSDYSVRAPA